VVLAGPDVARAARGHAARRARPAVVGEVEERVGHQRLGGLAGRRSPEAQHVTATAQVADLVLLQKEPAGFIRQQVEGQKRQVAVGGKQQPPVPAQGGRQPAEQGGAQGRTTRALPG
jgi:hypothetical protein